MGRKKKKKASSQETHASDDDEVTLDFAKYFNVIKGFFTSDKTSESKTKAAESSHDEEPSEDEVNLDMKWVMSLVKKYAVVFLILIPLVLSVTIRMQTEYLPITQDWAYDSVMNNVRGQIENQVNQQYPNLPSANRNRLVKDQLKQLLDSQADQIDGQIQATAQYFKDHFQDDTGNTYMPDIDPYHFMRLGRNLVEKGTLHDEVRDGVPIDNHMLAPHGIPVQGANLHPYVLAYFHKVAKVFSPNISVMRSTSYFPIVAAILSLIPLFLVARKISGNLGALVATILFSVNIAYLNRSLWGHADTDSYNLLIPILITWLFFEAADPDNSFKRSSIYAGLCGLVIGAYSYTWGGWWYMLNFILAAMGAMMVYYVLSRKMKDVKRIGATLGVFVGASGLFTTLFTGFNAFYKNLLFLPSISFTQIKNVAEQKVWPNVLTTVAELNEVDLNGIIHNIGAGGKPKLMFFLALFGLIVLIMPKDLRYKWFMVGSAAWYVLLGNMQNTLNKNIMLYFALVMAPVAAAFLWYLYKKDDNPRAIYGLFLLIWFVGTMYASTKGIRFVMLLVPAFSLAVGASFGFVFENLAPRFAKMINLKRVIILKVLVIVAAAFFLSEPVQSAYDMGRRDVPSVNDAWFHSLDKIKQESQPDAIITSWWDFGHWFKWYADRAVTFDGASQDRPQAHWVGKVLLTDDEELAVGILKMLHCGATDAFDTLYPALGRDHPKTIDVLYHILTLDRVQARQVLLNDYAVDEDVVNKLLDETHCNPPEAYFIASGDMIGKAGVWAHFGTWDFKKAQMFFDVSRADSQQAALTLLEEKFEYSPEKAQKLYFEIKGADANQWIAPWPNYVSGVAGCKTPGEDLVLRCPNNVAGQSLSTNIDLVRGTTNIDVGGQQVIPAAMGMVSPEGVAIEQYNESNFPYAPLVFPSENGGFQSIYMYPDLVGSTFTKMYHLRGHGLKYFDLFSYQRDITGLEIFVYKVDWSGESENLVYTLETAEPEPVVELVDVESDEEADAEASEDEAEETPESASEDIAQEAEETSDEEAEEAPVEEEQSPAEEEATEEQETPQELEKVEEEFSTDEDTA